MIQLFYPNIPDDIDNYILKTLHSKWIAQGPKVAEFEQKVNKMLSTFGTTVYSVGTNSTTSALHLSYILAGIKPDDEVITTVFSCVATNLPLLWLKANIVFADIEKETLNIDVDDVSRKISNNTKAIVCMNYGGNPCKLDKLRDLANKYNCKLICDNAHGSILSSTYLGHPLEYWCDYVIYSFQAIKMITTGDGGMITCKNKDEELLLKKLRWFGMDKEEKLEGKWNEDIEVLIRQMKIEKF
jgi:dTDP-4-amino-4,6-dideoxygalactose transaminase